MLYVYDEGGMRVMDDIHFISYTDNEGQYILPSYPLNVLYILIYKLRK